METTLEEQLIAQVRTLSPAAQQQMLTQLTSTQLQAVPHTPTPPGTPGKEAARFAGLFPPEDADEIMRAVEEGCGQIDYEGWDLTIEFPHEHE